jgi:PleD family two-component response regulator
MALYIPIRKVDEDSRSARYSFGEPGAATGMVSIDKASGAVESLGDVAGDEAMEHVVARVEHKLRQHWQRGEYPETTCWAS